MSEEEFLDLERLVAELLADVLAGLDRRLRFEVWFEAREQAELDAGEVG